MARVKFTVGRIESITCEAGKNQSFEWDTEAVGLGVRVTPEGRKTYVFQSRVDGRTVRTTIGDTRAWSLGQARDEARRLRVETNKGIDPRQVKRERIAKAEAERVDAAVRDVTVSYVWQLYIESRRSKWSPRTYFDHQKLSSLGGEPRKRGKGLTDPGILAPLMGLKLAQLSADTVETWLNESGSKAPTQTALGYRLLRAFINWLADLPEYRDAVNLDLFKSRKIKEACPKSKAKDDDCLQREMLPAWFSAVRSLSSRTVSAYLQILLLTGARRDELAGLKWADVDFQWNSLTIRDKDNSKGGVDGERIIPMTPYIRALLSDLKAGADTPPPSTRILHGKKIDVDVRAWRPSEFAFPGRRGGNLSEPSSGHRRALRIAGLPHVTIHGLRRSFGTLSEWVECPVGIVAQIMGHKPSAIAEKHYRRRPLDLLRMWHNKIEAWILEQAGIEVPKEQSRPALKAIKGAA